MMREIKFRGFSKTFNKWIIGVPYFSEGNWWILVDENTKSEDIGTGSYFVDKNSIGQHTGLKDKNSVETYEGDILNVFLPSVSCHTKDRMVKKLVSFENGAFTLEWIDNVKTGFWSNFNALSCDCTLEVIGNIYLNSELLEGSK